MGAQGHASEQDPRIGIVLLDRYRIVRKIGAGGMGDVYEGVHELIGKKLAIKCMHNDFAANAEAVLRFQQEARAATSVGNEHIVDVSDMGNLPDGSPFMVMEYLQGRELAGLIEEESPLPVPRVIEIALQILEALSAAHESGIVHRDMKPENVFLIQRGGNKDFVKVLDFGISMIAEHADAAKGRMTQTGVAMGTPNYMSPEQAKGARDVDQRTDLYSVGVILYEALVNDVPFDASSLAVLMTKILTEQPSSILEVRPDVPEALDRIILRAMAKEADIRFESAEEFASALRPFLNKGYKGPSLPVGRNNDNATVQLKPASVGESVEVERVSAAQTAQLPFASDAKGERTEMVDAAIEQTSVAGGSGKGIVIGAILVAGIAIGAFALTRKSSDSGEGASSAVAQQEVHTEKPTSSSVGKSAEVKVHINIEPSEAKVYLDGNPFPSGVAVSRPRSLAPVRIQVVLKGFKAIDDVAVFDKDRNLSFTMEPSALDAVSSIDAGMPGAKNAGAENQKGKRPKNGGTKVRSKIEKPESKDSIAKPTEGNTSKDSNTSKDNGSSGKAKTGDSKVYEGANGKMRTDF